MSGPRVVFVTGATATGKSDWALQVAEETGAVLINCDSVQVYAGLEIGANAPTAQERARAEHRLFGVIEAPRELTAGKYRPMFFESVKPEDKKILVVGGTGFYFQAIERGLFEAPPSSPESRTQIEAEIADDEGRLRLHAELVEADPVAAERVHPSDKYRLRRAMELLRAGLKPSEVRRDFKPQPFPFPLLKTGVRWPREELRRRIARRTRSMIERGLLSETQALLDRVEPDWAPLSSVGYRQAIEVLAGRQDEAWLEAEMNLRTAQLAKRQETWFQRDDEIQAFDGAAGFASFRECCLQFFDGNTTLRAP